MGAILQTIQFKNQQTYYNTKMALLIFQTELEVEINWPQIVFESLKSNMEKWCGPEPLNKLEIMQVLNIILHQWFPLKGKNLEGSAKSQVDSKKEPEVEELPPFVPFAHHASMDQPIFPMLQQAIKVPIVTRNLKNSFCSTNVLPKVRKPITKEGAKKKMW